MDFHRSTKCCWWLVFGPFTVIRKVDMQAGDCLGLGANKLGKFSKPVFCDEDDTDDLKNPEQNTFEEAGDDDGDRPSTSKNTTITKNGLVFFFFLSWWWLLMLPCLGSRLYSSNYHQQIYIIKNETRKKVKLLELVGQRILLIYQLNNHLVDDSWNTNHYCSRTQLVLTRLIDGVSLLPILRLYIP